MRNPAWMVPLTFLVLAGCVENTSPGNDRESQLDRAAPAAELVSASAAIAGVETSLLKPETMTEADVNSLGAGPNACVFRMTRVGYPVFIYSGGATASGTLKLNGKLVTLSGAGEGVFETGGVQVHLRPLEEAEGAGQRGAELVLLLPGAPNELGFSGFAECAGG